MFPLQPQPAPPKGRKGDSKVIAKKVCRELGREEVAGCSTNSTQSCGSSASSVGVIWCCDIQMVGKDTARQSELVAPSCWVRLPQNTAKTVSRDGTAISDFLVVGAG